MFQIFNEQLTTILVKISCLMLKKFRAQQNDNNQYPLYVFEQLLRSDLKRLLASQTIPPST